jgi:GNAT superfamily N-acetyltransferase
MAAARPARIEDLEGLLKLYAAVDFSAAAEPFDRASEIWRETLESRHMAVFVLDDGDEVVATCTLITAPNLLRGGRRHGFLENVATHPDHRGRGFGKAVVRAAIEHAWSLDCHHILMQSGRADPRVHSFYEAVGFRPGLRIGYVAMRP